MNRIWEMLQFCIVLLLAASAAILTSAPDAPRKVLGYFRTTVTLDTVDLGMPATDMLGTPLP